MKPRLTHPLMAALVGAALTVELGAQTNAFTYQGRLDDNGVPANGNYDLRFTVYDAATGGGSSGGPLTHSAVSVSHGLFTVVLNFGAGVFVGADRWLELGVRTNGGAAFVTLTPRQPLLPVPYAIHAGGVDATGVMGVLPSSALGGPYGNTVQFTDPGNAFVGSFTGDGSGLFNVDALSLNGKAAGDFWQVAGNAGTTAGDFVGTTDPQPLELRVNSSRALRLEPDPTSPNVLAGHELNAVAPAIAGAAIAGGGQAGGPNLVTGNFGVVGGGRNNQADVEAVVGGGSENSATAPTSTIGGGSRNQATAGGAVVAGGNSNSATNGNSTVSGGRYNIAGGQSSVVAGGGGRDPISGFGLTNRALGDWSAVGGGRDNLAGGESATVGGGDGNLATGPQSTTSGGFVNSSTGEYATVGGGSANTASGLAATVGGGQENGALFLHATVGGGVGNYASGQASTIAGGANNLASGPYAGVPGGREADPKQLAQISHASGMFATPGDAQRSAFVLRALTDINQNTALLALDGAGTRLKVDAGRTFTFDILLTARAEPPSSDSAGYSFQGVIKNAGGVASFVGAPVMTTLGQDVPFWSAGLLIVGDELTVQVDGGAGAGYPYAVRWVARVDAAEVAW